MPSSAETAWQCKNAYRLWFCFLSRPSTDEIVDRLRAKQEEELEEVKRRAALEVQKVRLAQEEEEEQAKGDGSQEEEVKSQLKQEAKEEKEAEDEEITATGNGLLMSYIIHSKIIQPKSF